MEPLIHIVDDDDAVRDSLRCLLDSLDMQSRCYATGRAFLEGEPLRRPGCALLDLRIPDMSGLEIQRWLIRQLPYLPVIFMSGYSDVAVSAAALRRGAVDFLTKPVDTERLLVDIREAVAQSRARLARQ